MALPGSLPKVTQYVKNLGKSVAYSTVDYFKDTMPETSDFLETNQELFKEITVAVKDYRRTLIAAERTIKKSKIWEAGTEMKKSIFDSIKTGKFYDKDREAYYETKAGGSLGSMDDDDFGGFNDFDIGGDDLSDEDRSATRVSNAVHDATVAQASIIAKSADYLAQTQKDSTKLLFTQNERLYNQVTNGMENMYNAMDNMMNFMKGPLTTHMQNSETFYRELTSRVDNISKTLTEIAEMQRNLYKREQKYMEKSQFSKVGAMPDIKEYAKQIKKNILNEVPELSMLLGNDMGEDSNMLLAWAANPLKVIPDTITKILIPKTIKTAVESIDKSLSGVFSSFIGKMNYAKDNDTSILGLIARVLGLKVNNKNTINSANYEKGPVPFDGITRKTIVEVIPGHLARIEAALVGREERVFDYETGKWVDVSKISKDWNRRQSWAIQSAFSGVDSDLRSEINKRKRGSDDDKKKAKELEDAAFKIMKKAFEDGKFYPYGVNRDFGEKLSPWEYYGINDKNTFQAIVELLIGRPDKLGKGVKPKKGATSLPYEILQGKESWANTLFNMEQSGQSSSRVLFNNAYNYGTGVGAGTKGNGTGIRNIIADATDKYNKNIFFYLRGIYAELDAIRSGRSGGGKNRKTRNIRSNLSSDDILKGFESSLGTPSDTVAGSNEEAGYDDSIGWISDIEELQDHNTAESEIARLQREGAKKDIKSLLRSDKISDRVKGLTYSFTKLLSAPGEAIAGVINLADARLYRLMFGNKPDFDPNDEEEDSFFNVMKKKFTEGFDNIFNKIDDTIDSIKTKLGVESFKELFEKIAVRLGLDKPINWIKDKVNKYWSPVKDKLKEKAGNAWRGFKGSMGRTFGYNGGLLSYFNRPSTDWSNVPIANADRVMQPSGIQGAGAFNMGWSNDDALTFLKGTGVIPKAKGGRVPWTGLYTLSAGERVIPNAGRQRQMRDLANERAVASMYGFNFPHMATAQPIIDNQPKEGKIIPFPGAKQEQEKVRKIIDEAMGNEGKGIPNIIASGLLGGGFSLLTGMVGGPLLGAAVGSAIGIVQNSNTIQTMLFGKEVTDENGNKSREGGLISKNLQDKFKKYFPDMKDWGLAGGVLGLFTPFGIVGGMAMGAMAGLVKNTDAFQDFIFGPKGEDGTRDDTKALISKKYREYLKKAAPSMLIGAAGAALLGPFGFLPNVVLGSAVGLGVQTEGFKKALFGEMGEDGKRHGGIIGALKDGFVTPIIQRGQLILKEAKRFAQKNIFDPLKRFIKPAAQMIKNGITGFFDHMKDFFTNTAKKIFFEPIQDWLEHRVFRGIFNVVSKLVKAPMSIAKGVVAAPFRLLGNIGDNIRAGQIAKGTANDMTAEERLEFRKTHRGRFVGRFFNPALSRDRQRSNDEFLAGLRKGGEKGIQQMQNIKKELNEFINIKNALGNKVSDAVQEAVKWLSDRLNSQYFEVTTFVGKTGGKVNDNAYDIIGYARVHRVNVLISQGKKEEVLNNISKWTEVMHKKCGASTTDNDIDGFIAGIVNNKEFNSLLDKVVSSMAQVKDTAGARNALLGKLQGVTGIKSLSDARKYMRNLDTEIDAAKADQEGKDPAEKAGDQISAVIAKKADYISGILIDILRASDPDAASKYNENGAASEGSNAAEASKELLSGRSWTKEDENYLREHYESDGVKACAEALHRSPGAIRARVSKLRKDGTWENQDEETPSETKKKNRLSTWFKNTFKRKIIKDYKTFEDTGIDVDVYEDNTEEVVHNGKYRKALRKKKKLDKTKEEVNEGTNKSLKNRMKILFGNIKNWAGFIGQKLKGGLLGLWANMNDSNTIIGKIFKGIKVVAFGALIVAALGHFSDWWKKKDIGGKISNFFTKLWNGDGTDRKPGLKNRLIWLWQGKDGSGGIKGFFSKLFPNVFGEGGFLGKDGFVDTRFIQPISKFIKDVQDPDIGFFKAVQIRVKDVFDKIVNWFKTGFGMFKDNILIPIWNWMSPKLELFFINLWDTLTNKKKRMDRYAQLTRVSSEDKTITAIDENGETKSYNYVENTNDYSQKGIITKVQYNTAMQYSGYSGGVISKSKEQMQDPDTGFVFSASYHDKAQNRYDQIDVLCESTNECISYKQEIDSFTYVCKKSKIDTIVENRDNLNGAVNNEEFYNTIAEIITSAKFTYVTGNLGIMTGSVAAGINAGKNTIYVPGFGGVNNNIFQTATVKTSYGRVSINIYEDIYVFSNITASKNSIFVSALTDFFIDPSNINNWPDVGDKVNSEGIFTNRENSSESGDARVNRNRYGSSSGYGHGSSTGVFDQYSLNNNKASGRGHLYMNDPGLSNIKYGNSTIGEAGCGPIAATNMINNIAPGRMNAMTAAYYGSMYQTSDGGTTPEYFSDIFGKAGIQSSQTDSKSKILKSVKNGNPAVLLGKSSRDSGTPFGSNNHYINLMGIDRKGNAIVEDPDLPSSRNVYPISKVLNDTISGITTGYSRSGRKMVANDDNFGGSVGTTNSGNNTIKTISTGSSYYGGEDFESEYGGKETYHGFDFMDLYNGVYKLGSGGAIEGKMTGSSFGDSVSGSIVAEEGDADQSKLHYPKGNDDDVRRCGFDPAEFRKYKISGNSSGEAALWNSLIKSGLKDWAAAGVLSNWYSESGLRTTCIECDWATSKETFAKYGGYDMCNLRGGMNAWYPYMKSLWAQFGVYLAENAYKGNDGNWYPGIGLAGWTGPRSQRLIAFAIANKQAWDSAQCQVGFFRYEMAHNHPDVITWMNNCKDPTEAARIYYRNCEMPGGSQESENVHKASAVRFYNKYHNGGSNAKGRNSIEGYARRSTDYSRSSSRINYASRTADSIIKSHGMSGTNGSYYSNGAYSGSYSGSARYSGSAGSTLMPAISYAGSGSYGGSLSTIIQLLSVIADNTDALNSLRENLAGRGANIDSKTLKAAAENAKKQSADSPIMAIFNGSGRDDSNASASQIVAAMELLAKA